MAAITRWVDALNGSDAANGQTFGTAWQTIDHMSSRLTANPGPPDGGLISLGDDVTVYIVNSATYTMDTAAGLTQIDDTTGTTYLFKGVSDSAMTPGMVDVDVPATGTAIFLYVRECGSCILEGFDVDFTASVADASEQIFLATRETGGDAYTIRYCKFTGATGTTKPAGVCRVIDAQGVYPDDWCRIHHCSLRNMQTPNISISGGAAQGGWVYNCVIIQDYSGVTVNAGSPIIAASFASVNSDIRIYNNTFRINIANAVSGAISGQFAITTASGDAGYMDFYNNVLFYETDYTANPPIAAFVGGGTGGSFSSGLIGHNLMYGGPSIAEADVTDEYGGAGPWPATPVTDTQRYEKAFTDLFNDPSSTFNWSVGGYVLVVHEDLRLVTDATLGFLGGVPGALGAASADSALTITRSTAVTAREGVNNKFTFKVTNNGPEDATGIEVSVTAHLQMTYVSDTGSGAYDTGTEVWTVGSLLSGASKEIIIVFSYDEGSFGSVLALSGVITAQVEVDTNILNNSATENIAVGPNNNSGDTSGFTEACVEGIYDYHYSNDGGQARQIIICASSNIYTDPGNHILTPRHYTLPTNGSQYTFTPMNEVCVICSDNESQLPLQLSSVDKKVVLLKSAPNLGFAVEHFSRVIGAGVPESPSFIFASGTLDQNNWEPGGNADDPIRLGITIDDGQRITGISSTHYGRLYIFKERSISVIDGAWTTAIDVARTTVSTTRGCISHHTIQSVGNDILFWSEQGCHSIIATDKFGDIETKDISFPIRKAFARLVDTLQMDKGFSLNFPKLDLYITWFKAKGQTNIGTAFVFHYGIGEWTIWEYEAKCVANIAGNANRRTMWTGGYDGTISEWPGDTFHTSVEMGTGGMAAGDAKIIKNYEEFQIHMVPWGDADAKATLQFIADRDKVLDPQEKEFSLLPHTGDVLGDFELGVSEMTDADEVLVAEIDFDGGTGRSARIVVEQDTSNVNLEILGYVTRVKGKGS